MEDSQIECSRGPSTFKATNAVLKGNPLITYMYNTSIIIMNTKMETLSGCFYEP